MELRLVDRRLSREVAFPFPNESRRIKGFGTRKGNELIGYDEDDNEIGVASVNRFLGDAVQDEGMCFLTVFDPVTDVAYTYAWSEKLFTAYIVNDNGKTIDKIAS